MTGTETILATRPVDPFDIFRGQYITIAYDIGNVQVPPEVEEGDRIYVVLKEDNESIARFDRVSLVKPDDILFIKGTVTDISGTFARVDYGIGQYFFERGAEFPTRNLQVRVKIAKNGQARIDALLINKTVIEMNYKNFSWKD